MAQNPRGVQVDRDARRMHDPVTVVVWPSRDGDPPIEQDADNWSDANAYVAMGAAIKDGYPTEPEMVLNPDAAPAPGNEPPQESRPAPAAAPRPAPAAGPPASS